MIIPSIEVLLACIVLPLLYAIGGLKTAIDKGEKKNWPIFVKTILLGLVSAGFLSNVTANLVIEVFGTQIITEILDSLVNGLMNKTQRTLA